jgi:hypothetical protein
MDRDSLTIRASKSHLQVRPFPGSNVIQSDFRCANFRVASDAVISSAHATCSIVDQNGDRMPVFCSRGPRMLPTRASESIGSGGRTSKSLRALR